ncbi:MAG: DNA translocase FtsK, partial [Gemmataceae bacterium]
MEADTSLVPPPTARQGRWDTATATLLLGWLGLGSVLATHPPLIGSAGPSRLGAEWDVWVGPLPAALGFAHAALAAATLWTILAYARGASWRRLVLLLAGMILITSTAALVTDAVAIGATPYGAGGAIGAYLSQRIRPWPWALPAAAGTLLSIACFTPAVLTFTFRSISRFFQMMTAPIVAWWNKPRAKPAEIVPLQPVSGDAAKPPLRAVNAAATPRAVTGPVTIPITAGATPAPLVSRLPSAEPAEAFDLPPLALLTDAEPVSMESQEGFLRERAALLEQTYADFGLTVKVVGIHTGPVITQYEIALETGLRLSRVTTLADDLALNLKVQSVRVVA